MEYQLDEARIELAEAMVRCQRAGLPVASPVTVAGGEHLIAIDSDVSAAIDAVVSAAQAETFVDECQAECRRLRSLLLAARLCFVCGQPAKWRMSGPDTNFEEMLRCDAHAHPIMRLMWEERIEEAP